MAHTDYGTDTRIGQGVGKCGRCGGCGRCGEMEAFFYFFALFSFLNFLTSPGVRTDIMSALDRLCKLKGEYLQEIYSRFQVDEVKRLTITALLRIVRYSYIAGTYAVLLYRTPEWYFKKLGDR
ncbi:MAG: hypothetical protein SWX82_00540 [Cyanobacteriota bacterium]|nr:hypothetical protein [Cyanobacteriota bacterium]